MLGADFKSNQTTKQLKNSISANRKVETNLTCFLLVQIKLFNCLVVWFFFKSAPWKDDFILIKNLWLLKNYIFHIRTRFYINNNKKVAKKKLCFMLGADLKSNQTTKQFYFGQ